MGLTIEEVIDVVCVSSTVLTSWIDSVVQPTLTREDDWPIDHTIITCPDLSCNADVRWLHLSVDSLSLIGCDLSLRSMLLPWLPTDLFTAVVCIALSISFLLAGTRSSLMVKRCLFHLMGMVPGCDVVADILRVHPVYQLLGR